MRRLFFYFTVILILAACGGARVEDLLFTENGGESGYIHLNLSGNVPPVVADRLAIEKYRVTLTGDGLESETRTVSKEAVGILVRGIPAGSNRFLEVAALNREGDVLRVGRAGPLDVKAGESQGHDIVLKAFPYLVNLRSEKHLSNRRLYFHLFTDPGHRVRITADIPLEDFQHRPAEFTANPAGFVKFYPALLPAGSHRFAVHDLDSELSNSLTLHLWDGRVVRGAPLISASGGGAGKNIRASRLGQPLAGPGGGEIEARFPNIAEALWTDHGF